MLKRIFSLSGVVALALILIFIFASLASASSPSLAPSTAGELYAPDRILVGFAPGVSASTMAAIHRANGAVLIREIPQIGVQVLRVPANQVPALVAAYSRNPNVLYAEPDYVAYAIEEPPVNDPYFSKQWGLDNDGQIYKDPLSGTVDADIDAPEAWDITTGSSDVKIAILDTGIDKDHDDLASKIVANVNFTNSRTVDDKYGHGTHVAGIAAAITNNGTGVAGVGYNSTLLNVKVLNDRGSGFYSWIASGITWAADPTKGNAQVINMSLGGYASSETLELAVNYAWEKGVVLAAAAGNDGISDKLYPAAYTTCIAVAATDDDDRVDEPGWWASNYGDWVDVAAPGLYIYSTFPNHDYAIGKSLNYDYGSGTSMSTPFVSGLAALVWATDYGVSNSAVRDRIESTADQVGDIWSIYGIPRINAYEAVVPAGPPLLTITTTSLPDGVVGQSYTATLEATGGTPSYTWDIVAGALPAGLSLTLPTGEISGTPTTAETQTFTVQVTDSADPAATDSQELSITINAAPTEPTTVIVTLPSGTDGYATEGGRNQDKHLNITVALVDDLDNPVAGASVSIDLYLDDSLYGSGTGTTETDGTVTFRFNNAPSGCYKTTVTNVTADSLTWYGATPPNEFCKP